MLAGFDEICMGWRGGAVNKLPDLLFVGHCFDCWSDTTTPCFRKKHPLILLAI